MDTIENGQKDTSLHTSGIVALKKSKILIAAGFLIITGFLVLLITTLWLNNRQTAEIRSSADSGGQVNVLASAPNVIRYDSSTIDFRIAKSPYNQESAFTYPSEVTPLTFAVGNKKMTIFSVNVKPVCDSNWRKRIACGVSSKWKF